MRTRTVPFLITAIMIAGCATVVAPLEPQLVSERLPFIRDGKTSKEEILNRLGEPVNRYEGSRILTYEMCEDISLEGRLRLMDTRPNDEKTEVRRTEIRCAFPPGRYKLILAFGPDDLLERHSLVLNK